MLRLDVVPFIDTLEKMAQLQQIVLHLRQFPIPGQPHSQQEELEQVAKEIRAQLVLLGLDFSLVAFDRRVAPALGDAQLERLPELLGELRTRVHEELETKVYFTLSASEKEFYEPSTPLFGSEVERKFSSISDEIAEAGRCIALGRGTACAFHSLRILEAALKAVLLCLGGLTPQREADRNWSSYLRNINVKIEQKWSTAVDKRDDDYKFFSAMEGALGAIRNPWRNATMHLDRNYSVEDSRDLFLIIRGIMRMVASRCDEHGHPKV